MNKIFSAFFLLGLLLTGALIVRKNPYLFSDELLPSHGEGLIWETIKFQETTKDQKTGSQAFFYRQDLQRNARFFMKKMPGTFKEIWKTNAINVGVHSASKASAITDGRLVFAGGDTGEFYCYDTDGKLRWSFYLGDASFGIHSTAAVDDEYVYVGSYRGSLYKIRKETGNLEWARQVGQTIGASPFLDGDFIVFPEETLPRNGYVIKMNKHSGEIVWRTRFLGEQSHSSPALSLDKKILVLGANNNKAFGINYKSGEIIWEVLLDGKIKSTPLIIDNEVYLTTWGGTLFKLQIENGKVSWRSSLGSGSQVSPAYLEKMKLIIASGEKGELKSFHRESGKESWRLLNPRPGFQLSSPVIITDGKQEQVLFNCDEMTMCLITDSGKVRHKFKINGRITSSPMVSEGKLYLTLNEGGIEAYALLSQ